jgi:hypothetical protein
MSRWRSGSCTVRRASSTCDSVGKAMGNG